LENKTNRIYATILVITTIMFIVGMVKIVFSVNFTASTEKVVQMVSGSGSSESVEERLEYLDEYVDRHGPEVIFNELYYGHNYEPEFDSYWEFADIQVAGIRGRFADDNSKDVEIIREYIERCSDAKRKEVAQRYLDMMMK